MRNVEQVVSFDEIFGNLRIKLEACYYPDCLARYVQLHFRPVWIAMPDNLHYDTQSKWVLTECSKRLLWLLIDGQDSDAANHLKKIMFFARHANHFSDR